MRLVVSCGDPHGIGLEVLLKAVQRMQDVWHLTLCVNVPTLQAYITALGIDARIEDIVLRIDRRSIHILPCESASVSLDWGVPTISSGMLAYESLRRAAQAVRSGSFDALVTLPVSKTALMMAGFRWAGQTEFLGDLSQTTPLMILASEHLKVALATTHLPLVQVATSLTREREQTVLELFHTSLSRDWGIASPRIAVLGLNPHAGEDGLLGAEEHDVIIPAIEQTRSRNMHVDGPFSADGFFAKQNWRVYDGVVAQYHDQGLIPLKMLAEGKGVNVTAGLPFIRTSPGHGTAYDIAGKNCADCSSVIEALRTAQYLARNRFKYVPHHPSA